MAGISVAHDSIRAPPADSILCVTWLLGPCPVQDVGNQPEPRGAGKINHDPFFGLSPASRSMCLPFDPHDDGAHATASPRVRLTSGFQFALRSIFNTYKSPCGSCFDVYIASWLQGDADGNPEVVCMRGDVLKADRNAAVRGM